MSARGHGFDIVGWMEAAPGAGTVGVTSIVGDDRYKASDDDIDRLFVGVDKLLALFYAAESTPNYCELRQPSLREAQRPRSNVSMDLNDADPRQMFTDLTRRPMTLKAKEKLTGISVNATDEDTVIAAILGTGFLKTYEGPIDAIIRGIGDLTLTALTWGTVSMIWTPDLMEGRYRVVGMIAAAYVAAGYMTGIGRLIFKEKGADFRPGVPLIHSEADKTSVMSAIRPSPLEFWPSLSAFEFENDNPPGYEAASPAALTDHVVQLYLQKVR